MVLTDDALPRPVHNGKNDEEPIDSGQGGCRLYRGAAAMPVICLQEKVWMNCHSRSVWVAKIWKQQL